MLDEFFDIRTLSLVSGVVCISIFIVMLYVSLRRKIYPGFKEWTLGAFFNCFGLILVASRNFMPDFLSVILANNLILLFYIFTTRGLSRFANHPQKNWMDIASVVILTVAFSIFTYLNPNVNYRIVIFMGLTFLVSVRMCYLIWTKMPTVIHSKPVLLFLTVAVQGIWNLLRLVLTILLEENLSDFMEAGTLQGFAFIIMVSTYVIISMLLIIKNSQRIEEDLVSAQEEVKNLSGLLPICSNCKKIRNETESWENLETYISSHSEALFSHGMCPDCMKKLYPDYA